MKRSIFSMTCDHSLKIHNHTSLAIQRFNSYYLIPQLAHDSSSRYLQIASRNPGSIYQRQPYPFEVLVTTSRKQSVFNSAICQY